LPFLWWKEFFQDKIKFFYFRALSSSGIWLKSSFKMGAVLDELVMDYTLTFLNQFMWGWLRNIDISNLKFKLNSSWHWSFSMWDQEDI
jgi:hypothetical protein